MKRIAMVASVLMLLGVVSASPASAHGTNCWAHAFGPAKSGGQIVWSGAGVCSEQHETMKVVTTLVRDTPNWNFWSREQIVYNDNYLEVTGSRDCVNGTYHTETYVYVWNAQGERVHQGSGPANTKYEIGNQIYINC